MSEKEIQEKWLLLQKLARQEQIEKDVSHLWVAMSKTSTQKKILMQKQRGKYAY